MTATYEQTLQDGRYRIVRPLGQGGMGAIYLAEDQNLPGRKVAVKENLDHSPLSKQLFMDEATILARLRHANLPQVTDYFVEPTSYQYLVMDYIEGSSLMEIQERYGALQERDVLQWADQVIGALSYMHSWIDPTTRRKTPIIHRDIKPSNIKRTPNGQIVLVDFGIAKYDAADNSAMSVRVVSHGFAPIEQYHGGTDARSDIYSLGATIYSLLTGVLPPKSTTTAAGEPIPLPRSFNDNISPNTERVILKAMQTQQAQRFQSVQEMRTALAGANSKSAFTGGRSRSRPATAPVSSPVDSPQKRQKSNRFVWGGLAAFGSLVLIAAAFLLLTPAANPTVTSDQGSALSPPNINSSGEGQSAQPAVAMSAGLTETETLVQETATIAPSPTALIEPTLHVTSTPIPIATEISVVEETPTPTLAPTSTPIDLSNPTPTHTTIAPTSTPVPTSQPTVFYAQPTAIVLPPTVIDSNMSVSLIWPDDGASNSGRQEFQWAATSDLPDGQGFELIFWKEGQNALTDGFGPAGYTMGTSTMVDLNAADNALGPLFDSGDYLWGIRLVNTNPYQPIRLLSGERRFSYASTGGGSSSGSSSSCTGAACRD